MRKEQMQMGEDIASEIQTRIFRRVELLSDEGDIELQSDRGVRRQSFIGALATQEGISIKELGEYGFATEEARRFLAGFVVSASAGGIPAITENHVKLRQSSGLFRTSFDRLHPKVNRISGWRVRVNRVEYPDDRQPVFNSVLASPDYRLYTQHYNNRGGLISPKVVRESVVETLVANGVSWVEPDPSSYM